MTSISAKTLSSNYLKEVGEGKGSGDEKVCCLDIYFNQNSTISLKE